MGRDLHFKGGSFYRVDDRTGFPTRAERTRREWNGLIVGDQYWEARQPQDLVRGVPDYQAVPEPRPLAPTAFVGPLYFQIAAQVNIGDIVVELASVVGIGVGDPVGIVLNADSGDIFRTTVGAVFGFFVVLNAPAPQVAASGNLLVDYAPGTGTGANTYPRLDFHLTIDSQYLGAG